MRITVGQLRKLIREEVERALIDEGGIIGRGGYQQATDDMISDLERDAVRKIINSMKTLARARGQNDVKTQLRQLWGQLRATNDTRLIGLFPNLKALLGTSPGTAEYGRGLRAIAAAISDITGGEEIDLLN